MSATRIMKRKQRQGERMTPRAKKLASGGVTEAQSICQCYKTYEEHFIDGTCPGHPWRKFKKR